MLAAERKQLINELIQEKKSVSVAELSERFGVTGETIRRDLKALEREGSLTRTYGGAFVQSGVENLINAELRKTLYVEEKEIIADRCRALIDNGDALFLDNSTTCFFLARAIQDMHLTIVTNNLPIMNLLAKNESIRLVSIGGEFSIPEQSFYGSVAMKLLREYYVDKSFVSCRTLSIENGVTESTDQWAFIRQLMLERSNEHYLAADHTKFDRTSFVRITGYDDISAIITDRPLRAEWHELTNKYGCRIIDAPTS